MLFVVKQAIQLTFGAVLVVVEREEFYLERKLERKK